MFELQGWLKFCSATLCCVEHRASCGAEAQCPGAAIFSEALWFPLASEVTELGTPLLWEVGQASTAFLPAPFLLSQAQREPFLPPLPQDSFLSESRLSLEIGSLFVFASSSFPPFKRF